MIDLREAKILIIANNNDRLGWKPKNFEDARAVFAATSGKVFRRKEHLILVHRKSVSRLNSCRILYWLDNLAGREISKEISKKAGVTRPQLGRALKDAIWNDIPIMEVADIHAFVRECLVKEPIWERRHDIVDMFPTWVTWANGNQVDCDLGYNTIGPAMRKGGYLTSHPRKDTRLMGFRIRDKWLSPWKERKNNER